MKLARLVCAVLALALVSSFSTVADACEKHKAATATAAKATPAKAADAVPATAAATHAFCTPEMAAACTPEMKAACQAAMAAGNYDHCGNAATAVTASAKGASKAKAGKAVAADAKGCCATKASAVTAASSGARAAKATAVLAGSDGACATKTSAVAAGSGAACGTKAAKAATANKSCSDHGMSSMAAVNGHDDCEACVDMADCSGALDAAGAHRQAIRLKNGIMYVYTADSPRTVSAVQAAVARRVDRMAQFASAGEKARLCDECKTMRGAMASGKLVREVVNIEGGTLTLVTSSDPKMVEKIHAMTSETKAAARAKS